MCEIWHNKLRKTLLDKLYLHDVLWLIISVIGNFVMCINLIWASRQIARIGLPYTNSCHIEWHTAWDNSESKSGDLCEVTYYMYHQYLWVLQIYRHIQIYFRYSYKVLTVLLLLLCIPVVDQYVKKVKIWQNLQFP